MLAATHGHCPSAQSEYGIDTHTQHLSVCFFKLRQRTVERGSLIASARCESEWEGMYNDPFAMILAERDLLAIMTFQFDIGRCGPCLYHSDVLLFRLLNSAAMITKIGAVACTRRIIFRPFRLPTRGSACDSDLVDHPIL